MGAWSVPSVQVEVPFQFSFTRPRVNTSTSRPTKTAMDLRSLEIISSGNISTSGTKATPWGYSIQVRCDSVSFQSSESLTTVDSPPW